MRLTNGDLENMCKTMKEEYTLMGSELCIFNLQKGESCDNCISRTPCILKNVVKDICNFKLFMGKILGVNIPIEIISPHLIMLADLLLLKGGKQNENCK